MDIRAAPFVVVPFLGSIYSRRVVERNMAWYDSLKRPSFAPPKWIFPPVWSALYASMGLASFLVWRDASREEAALPLACYGAQLLLNWSWTSVFFGAHKLKAVSYPICIIGANFHASWVLWIVLSCSMNSFFHRNVKQAESSFLQLRTFH